MTTIDYDGFPKAPNQPVIIVHMPDPTYPKLTACGPRLMPDPPADQWLSVPRYPCPGCYRILMQEVEE